MKEIIASLVFMIIGIVVYYFTRTDILFFSQLGVESGAAENLNWMSNHIPDLSFSVSCGFAFKAFKAFGFSKFYQLVILIYPFIHEILQLTHIFTGTFDFIDLGLYVLVISLFIKHLQWNELNTLSEA